MALSGEHLLQKLSRLRNRHAAGVIRVGSKEYPLEDFSDVSVHPMDDHLQKGPKGTFVLTAGAEDGAGSLVEEQRAAMEQIAADAKDQQELQETSAAVEPDKKHDWMGSRTMPTGAVEVVESASKRFIIGGRYLVQFPSHDCDIPGLLCEVKVVNFSPKRTHVLLEVLLGKSTIANSGKTEIRLGYKWVDETKMYIAEEF